MNGLFKPLNPRQTYNIGSEDHLTQVQHKVDHVDVVDHFDHGSSPVGYHVIHRIDSSGNVNETDE